MRILRVRRGYTTNSSGANEWVPPKNTTYNPPKPQTPGQVTVLATQPGVAGKAGDATPAEASAGRGATNLGLMAILVGAVCLLFGLTAWLRRRLRRR